MASENVDKVTTGEWNEMLNPKRKRMVTTDKKKTDDSTQYNYIEIYKRIVNWENSLPPGNIDFHDLLFSMENFNNSLKSTNINIFYLIKQDGNVDICHRLLYNSKKFQLHNAFSIKKFKKYVLRCA